MTEKSEELKHEPNESCPNDLCEWKPGEDLRLLFAGHKPSLLDKPIIRREKKKPMS